MKRVLGVLAIGLCVSGCSRDTSPAAPTSPYPNVAGNYSGTITFSFTSLGSLTCPATTTVTQTGASVSFTPLAISGSCGTASPSLPLGNFTISTTGSIGETSQNNVFVASCNGDYNVTIGGGFSGSTFQFSATYTAVSGGCVSDPGNLSLTVNVAR